MNKKELIEFLHFAFKVIIVHFATYLIFGMIFSNIFNYKAVFEMDIIKDFYIPYESHNIILGPLLQPVRGLLFAFAIWPLRDFLKKKKNGWLTLWLLIVMLGIFSTPGAAPSSIEGILYTKIPLWFHLMGLPEILLQTLAFSFILLFWDKKPSTASEIKVRKIIYEIVNAVSTACFAYIGYAVGALLMLLFSSLATTGQAAIDPDVVSAGSDFKIQFMFILAFIINAATVYFIGKKYSMGKMKLWKIFIFYFIIDTLVPWIYQIFITPPGPSVIFALMLGLFPSLIITLSIKLNYKRIK